MNAARTEQLTRVLRVASVVAIAVAVAALLWRPSLEAALPDEAAGTLAADSALTFVPLPADRAGDAQRIVANNLFATSRRPPGRRYAPANDADSTPAAVGDAGMAYDPMYATDAPALLGTVIDALGARALILTPAVDSAPRFYRVGERTGAYRVRRIEAGRVWLDGPSGRIVLQLLKPNEARP
jgi:hypothetical protein